MNQNIHTLKRYFSIYLLATFLVVLPALGGIEQCLPGLGFHPAYTAIATEYGWYLLPPESLDLNGAFRQFTTAEIQSRDYLKVCLRVNPPADQRFVIVGAHGAFRVSSKPYAPVGLLINRPYASAAAAGEAYGKLAQLCKANVVSESCYVNELGNEMNGAFKQQVGCGEGGYQLWVPRGPGPLNKNSRTFTAPNADGEKFVLWGMTPANTLPPDNSPSKFIYDDEGELIARRVRPRNSHAPSGRQVSRQFHIPGRRTVPEGRTASRVSTPQPSNSPARWGGRSLQALYYLNFYNNLVKAHSINVAEHRSGVINYLDASGAGFYASWSGVAAYHLDNRYRAVMLRAEQERRERENELLPSYPEPLTNVAMPSVVESYDLQW